MSCATQCSYVPVIVHTYIVPLHLHVHACAMRELIDCYKNECKVNLSFITFSLCMQNNPQLSNMEFGRRLAVERELEKTDYFSLPNACKKMYSHN